MSTYKELLAQKEELEKKIAEIQTAERGSAIASVREMIAEYNLTEAELFSARKGRTGTVAPKYQDPATGATWTGRGKPPVWIKDKNREEFLIK